MMSINAGVYSLAPARVAYAQAKDALAIAAREQGETAEAKYVEATIAFGERNWLASERALIRALDLDSDHVPALCCTRDCSSRWGGPPRRGRCFNAPGRSIHLRRTRVRRPGSVWLRRGRNSNDLRRGHRAGSIRHPCTGASRTPPTRWMGRSLGRNAAGNPAAGRRIAKNWREPEEVSLEL